MVDPSGKNGCAVRGVIGAPGGPPGIAIGCAVGATINVIGAIAVINWANDVIDDNSDSDEGPFETDGVGKVKDKDLDPDSIGDAELEAGIGQLEASFEQRKAENENNPRGNPNSPDPNDRENAQRRKRHIERIVREQRLLDELRRRAEEAGS